MVGWYLVEINSYFCEYLISAHCFLLLPLTEIPLLLPEHHTSHLCKHSLQWPPAKHFQGVITKLWLLVWLFFFFQNVLLHAIAAVKNETDFNEKSTELWLCVVKTTVPSNTRNKMLFKVFGTLWCALLGQHRLGLLNIQDLNPAIVDIWRY